MPSSASPASASPPPIAEGISRAKVLDHGYAGHYPHTTQPGQPGDFALAGHRNTHGEPFRRIDASAPATPSSSKPPPRATPASSGRPSPAPPPPTAPSSPPSPTAPSTPAAT
ncbi:sortase domain-bontaining protein [Actinacidiphila glaucinigra]|uniref:sortase domain-containing protein n=1 Tax=Actinacidiphila glaucinigra TaxID=235986 RepID=UPI0037FF1B8D